MIGPALGRPFMGTNLTIGGAIVTLIAAPAFWFLFLLVWTALPA